MDPSGTVTSASAGSRTSPEACSQPIQNQPYTRVYSNDVFAGGGFAGSTCSNVAPIYGYQHPGTARGSSTQLAAFALGVISGFSSAQIKNPTTSLTFANTPGLGNFGGTQCIPDFYGAKPTATTAVTSPVDPSGFDGAYEYSGSDLTIDSGSPPIKIPPSRRIAIFASGNVYIRKDVQFNGAVPWTSQSEVPAFYVIAKGNIYIDPSVTQLSGVFVSQGGTIYTCASHAPPYTSAELYNSCTNGPAKQLTVFGSLVGQGIKLQRAYSSMRHSTDNESPVGPAHSCDIVGGSGVDPFQVCSAEWIIFDPSIYLSQPPFRSDPDLRFDAVTSLPPIL